MVAHTLLVPREAKTCVFCGRSDPLSTNYCLYCGTRMIPAGQLSAHIIPAAPATSDGARRVAKQMESAATHSGTVQAAPDPTPHMASLSPLKDRYVSATAVAARFAERLRSLRARRLGSEIWIGLLVFAVMSVLLTVWIICHLPL